MDSNRNDSPNDRNPGGPKKPKGNLWVTLIFSVAIMLLFSFVYNAIENSQYT